MLWLSLSTSPPELSTSAVCLPVLYCCQVRHSHITTAAAQQATAMKLELNHIEGNTDEPAFLTHKFEYEKLYVEFKNMLNTQL